MYWFTHCFFDLLRHSSSQNCIVSQTNMAKFDVFGVAHCEQSGKVSTGAVGVSSVMPFISIPAKLASFRVGLLAGS
jgi:hypothetical protein